jgi:hypothetical protein
MNTHADKTQENKSQSVANAVTQRQQDNASTFQFVDNRPEAVAQRKLQEMANNSPKTKQVAQLQAMVDNRHAQQHPIQKKENNTGLLDNLKTGMVNLSGVTQLNGDEDGESLKKGPGLLDATGAGLGILGAKAYFGFTRTLIENNPKPLMKFGGGIGAQQVGGNFSTIFSMASLGDSFKGFLKADVALKAVKGAPLLLGASLMAKKFYDTRQEYNKDDE